MEVRTDSWHYKVYQSTYFADCHVPVSTDICQYMRRIFLSPFIWLVAATATIFVFLFVTLFSVVFFWGVPRRFIRPTPKGLYHFFSHDPGNYYRFPSFVIGSFGVRPVGLIVLACLGMIALVGYAVYLLINSGHAVGFVLGILVPAALMFFVVIIVKTIKKLRDAEIVRLVGVWLKSKKEKYCVPIQFKQKTP